MNFWGALATVGNTPYDSDRFVNVESVVRVMKGMNTSDKLRVQNGKPSQLTKMTTSSRENQPQSLLKSRKETRGCSWPNLQMTKKHKMKKSTAMVRQLGASMEIVYRRERQGAEAKHQRKDNGQPNDRSHDSAEPRHGGCQSGSQMSAQCPLCGEIGHPVEKCPDFCFSDCGETGHTKKGCQHDNKCEKCGKTNHTTTQCWRDKTCLKCAMRGHFGERCRTFLGSREEIRPRPQEQRPVYCQKGDRTRYKCGRPGHIARDCLSNQAGYAPATCSNRVEISRNGRSWNDDQDLRRIPVKDERKGKGRARSEATANPNEIKKTEVNRSGNTAGARGKTEKTCGREGRNGNGKRRGGNEKQNKRLGEGNRIGGKGNGREGDGQGKDCDDCRRIFAISKF